MKKLLTTILSLAVIAAFCACGADEVITSDTANAKDTSEAFADVTDTEAEAENNVLAAEDEAVYTVTLDNGAVIPVGSTSEEAVSALGTPMEILEAPSCIHEGSDRVYTFDGFSITTSPDGKGNQYIAEFSLLSDLVAFESGLTVGSPETELAAAFGEDFEEQFGVLTYKLDGATVSVVTDGGIISGITVSVSK